MITSKFIKLTSDSVKTPLTTSVRYFQPKTAPFADPRYRGEIPKRCGYEAHHHTKGLLPRLTVKEARLGTMPMTSKEDNWSRRKANIGRGDFLCIMGNEDVQQYDNEALKHVPEWLRGYRALSEYSVLMRKRREFEHWKYSKPTKWLHLEQRIKFLYRKINNKWAPPDVEKLSRSRHEH